MRRKRRRAINIQPAKTREELESQFGQVWTVQEVAKEYVICAIIGSTVVVRRKADDVVGSLQYQEGPPYLYFNFTEQSGSDL